MCDHACLSATMPVIVFESHLQPIYQDSWGLGSRWIRVGTKTAQLTLIWGNGWSILKFDTLLQIYARRFLHICVHINLCRQCHPYTTFSSTNFKVHSFPGLAAWVWIECINWNLSWIYWLVSPSKWWCNLRGDRPSRWSAWFPVICRYGTWETFYTDEIVPRKYN